MHLQTLKAAARYTLPTAYNCNIDISLTSSCGGSGDYSFGTCNNPPPPPPPSPPPPSPPPPSPPPARGLGVNCLRVLRLTPQPSPSAPGAMGEHRPGRDICSGGRDHRVPDGYCQGESGMACFTGHMICRREKTRAKCASHLFSPYVHTCLSHDSSFLHSFLLIAAYLSSTLPLIAPPPMKTSIINGQGFTLAFHTYMSSLFTLSMP